MKIVETYIVSHIRPEPPFPHVKSNRKLYKCKSDFSYEYFLEHDYIQKISKKEAEKLIKQSFK
jgi:hypothetical protein